VETTDPPSEQTSASQGTSGAGVGGEEFHIWNSGGEEGEEVVAIDGRAGAEDDLRAGIPGGRLAFEHLVTTNENDDSRDDELLASAHHDGRIVPGGVWGEQRPEKKSSTFEDYIRLDDATNSSRGAEYAPARKGRRSGHGTETASDVRDGGGQAEARCGGPLCQRA